MNRLSLAWAGGFFDAEGSTVILTQKRRWLRLRVQVPQNERMGGREVLVKFAEAVGGVGLIGGPDETGLHVYYTTRTGDAIEVLQRLLPWVGPIKRKQALDASARMLAYLRSTSKPIGPRSIVRRRNHDALATIHASAVAPDLSIDEAVSWAAGLFDGDGSVRYSFGAKTLCAEVTQASTDGSIADVLVRFRAVVGYGRFTGPRDRGPGTIPQYVWTCTAREQVESVFDRLYPHLSAYKRVQWTDAIRLYAAAPIKRHASLSHACRELNVSAPPASRCPDR